MNGILIPYIKKDIDTISIPHELYKKLYLIFCYLTMWSLIFTSSIIYLTKKGYKFPAFIWRSAFSLTITFSIGGTYFAYSKTDKFVEKYKIPPSLIYITDFFTHIIPFFVVLSYKKFMINNSLAKTKYLFFKMIGFNTLFISSYFYLFGNYLYPATGSSVRKFLGFSFLNLCSAAYFSKV